MKKFLVFIFMFWTMIMPGYADFREYVVPSGAEFFVKNCDEINLNDAYEGKRADFVLSEDFIYGTFKVQSGAKLKGTITNVKKSNETNPEITLTEMVTLNGEKIPVAGRVEIPKTSKDDNTERIFAAGDSFAVTLLRPVTINPSVK